MSAGLIACMIMLFTAQSLVTKLYADAYPGTGEESSQAFSIISGLTVALVTFTFIGFRFSAVPLTIFMGVLNGLVLFGYNYFLICASRRGPYSILMSFSISGGILLPTFVIPLFTRSSISWIRLLAVGVMIIASLLICKKPGEQKSEKSFFVLCIGLFVCNGLYGCFLSLQQMWTGESEKEELVIITFLTAAVLSLILLGIRNPKDAKKVLRQTKRSGLFLAIGSLVAAAAINVLTYIIPLVNTTVLYSLDNAGTLLCSMICSAIAFREKMTPYNIAGGILMCAALVCVSCC